MLVTTIKCRNPQERRLTCDKPLTNTLRRAANWLNCCHGDWVNNTIPFNKCLLTAASSAVRLPSRRFRSASGVFSLDGGKLHMAWERPHLAKCYDWVFFSNARDSLSPGASRRFQTQWVTGKVIKIPSRRMEVRVNMIKTSINSRTLRLISWQAAIG